MLNTSESLILLLVGQVELLILDVCLFNRVETLVIKELIGGGVARLPPRGDTRSVA